jgi:site-specific DNA-methyltransferase (adenine-specific)
MSEGKKEILLGDCLELMKDIPNGSIDMILCDLPYGMTSNKWDCEINLIELWKQYKRVIKSSGIIALTAGQPFTSKLVSSNFDMFRHEWIWEKDGGSNFANTVREPMKEHESILIFSKGKWVYNKQMEERIGSRKGKITKSVYNTKTENYNSFTEMGNVEVPIFRVPRSIQRFTRERGLHPTQKPVALFEYLIKTYTNEGDLVLDNCAGSGTTAIACLNTNRQFILMEQDPNYFEKIKKRVGDFNKKFETQTLFGNEM